MDGRELTVTAENDELATAVEAVVRATPGVRNLFRSSSLISQLLRAGAVAIGVRKDDEPIVSVVPVDDGVAVEASIGVDFGARSGDVLRAVHAAVDSLLEARGLRRESITLTVVHVPSREG